MTLSIDRRITKGTIRKQMNMSLEAWQVLDELRNRLDWSQSRLIDHCLMMIIEGKVPIEPFVQRKNNHELEVSSNMGKRKQKGMYFHRDCSDFLHQVVRHQYSVSMSSFCEQIFMHPKIETLFYLKPQKLEKETELERFERFSNWGKSSIVDQHSH